MITLAAINQPTDGVRHKQSETGAFDGEIDLGLGTLYITESFLIWISNDGRGFSLSYPTISLHAISRDARNFPRPCIYMVLDSNDEKIGGRSETSVHEHCFAEKMAACSLKVDSSIASGTRTGVGGDAGEESEHNGSTNQESDDEGDGEQSRSAEIRFVPADVNSLETMYHALSECQALHPDENESFSEDDEDESDNVIQVGGASEEFQFDESGQLVLSRMRGVRTDEEENMEHENPANVRENDDEEMETGQFEDATE